MPNFLDVAAGVVTVPKDGYGSETALNVGPGSLFYKAGTTVSSGSNDGTLASGSSLSLTGPTSFVAVSQGARLVVADPVYVDDPPGVGQSLLLPGATLPTRSVGGTSAGAPVSGTFAVGDFVVDQVGTVWVCTVAGTPGTWVSATNSELAYAEITSPQTVPLVLGDIPGLSITFPARTTAIELAAYFPRITKDTTASYVWLTITDGANFGIQESVNSMVASGFVSPHITTKVTGLTPGTSYTYKVRGITGAGVTTINATTFASGNAERPFIRAWSA